MLRSNRVTVGMSQATRAAYGAESGNERALYYLEYARSVQTVGVEAAVDAISNLTETFDTGASYKIVAAASDDNYAVNLSKNVTQQWDMYGESYPAGYTQPPTLVPLSDLDNIAISWNESSSCSLGNSVEIAFSSWTQYAWEDISDPDTIQTRYIVQCPHTDATSTYDCNYWLGVDDTHLYKVRVKPLDCALEDVTVSGLDSTNAVITSNNLVTISSTGGFGGSTQIVQTVETLWSRRLHRYFDFVIFSQDEITK
jgi:hypothetical protein